MTITQQQIDFQNQTFNNKVSFCKAIRMLNTQTSFRPTHIANDLVRWESNYGLSVAFNKANKMVMIKSSSLELLYQATGDVGEHIFKMCIQPKISCK